MICPPEQYEAQLVHLVAHPEAQGADGPPLGGVNISSSITIRRPGDRRRVPLGCRTAEISAASLNTGFSIAGGRSPPVCRGRAPCMGSVGSSQSSRGVFSDLVSLRILSIMEMVFTLCLIVILDPFFSKFAQNARLGPQ